MKAMEAVMLRIYIPDDEAHLGRVLDAIKEFGPSGDVSIVELRRPFDDLGNRLPPDQKSLMIEFIEEQCRAQIFVDALHDDFKPASIVATFITMLEGDITAMGTGTPADTGQAGAQS